MAHAAGLPEAIVATLIIAIGLFAIGLAALRSASGDRASLWFGLFGCLYGVRLAADSELLQPLLPEVLWRYLTAFITYAIIVPAGLFVESLIGPGWQSALRRTWQVVGIYAVVAMLNDLVRGQPGATLWLNPPVVLAAGSVAIAHLLVYRRWGSWPRELRIALLSGLIFLGVAAFQTVREGVHVEHFAMLIFMTAVGYAVTQRMLTTERRFIAVSRELEIAREIQRSILPGALPGTDGLCVAARYLPMNEVGGDFYDFDTQQPNRLGLIVADVSGHGVPAALVASMVKMGFAAEAERLGDPGLVLKNINRMLCGKFAGAYVTACCGFIDEVERRLWYASAGHPAPLLRRRDGRVERLDEHGLLLAFSADADYTTAEVPLSDGDRLVFFTDGLVEARNASDEFFDNARLEQRLATGSALTPTQLIDQIVVDLQRWIDSEAEFQDDVTVVVIDVGRTAVRDHSEASA